MVVDVRMAFVVALLFEILGLANKHLKKIAVIACCTRLIFIYFCEGCTIGFAGEMDLLVWILFVILFDALFQLLERRIVCVLKQDAAKRTKK